MNKDLEDPWFGYFPIENEDNEERLKYQINKLEDISEEGISFLMELVETLSNTILTEITTLEKYLSRSNWIELKFVLPRFEKFIINVYAGNEEPCYLYLEYKLLNKIIEDSVETVGESDLGHLFYDKEKLPELITLLNSSFGLK